MQSNPLYYLITGEKSGDMHGSKLMHALKKHSPLAEFKGVGGHDMQAEGLKPVIAFENLQVMGFTDVFFALPRLIPLFYRLAKNILQDKPACVIFIDYPGFNIRLAKYLRKKGYQGKLVHYIAPSVWAWGKGRIQTMSQTLDLLLTIFPFEPGYFEKTNLKTVYVGNPLMEALPELQSTNQKTLTLFPGSRVKEIDRNLPLQVEAAKLFLKANPEWDLKVSVSDSRHKEKIQALLKELPYSLSKELPTSGICLAKSGTVTLELALRGCPTVVQYQLTKLNYFLAKYIFHISLPHYALPNILLNESVFPEFYQVHIDPKELASALNTQAKNQDLIQEKAKQLRTLLTNKTASMEAAKEITKL